MSLVWVRILEIKADLNNLTSTDIHWYIIKIYSVTVIK